jgi:hypothetical protein
MSAYKLTGLTPLGRHEARKRRCFDEPKRFSSNSHPAQVYRGCHATDRRDDWPADKRAGQVIQLADGLLDIDRTWFRAHPWATKYVRPMVPDEFHPFHVVCTRDRCSWVIVRRHDSKASPARQPLAVSIEHCPEDG